jgi:hypothetical protein
MPLRRPGLGTVPDVQPLAAACSCAVREYDAQEQDQPATTPQLLLLGAAAVLMAPPAGRLQANVPG